VGSGHILGKAHPSLALVLSIDGGLSAACRALAAEEIQRILREKGDIEDADPRSAEAPLVIANAPSVPFCIYHHASASNLWLQVADYCAWPSSPSGSEAKLLHLID
jgi:hypothetical protein